jgi:hypothetical protein
MSEVDKIKRRVFNLLNKTVENGCTEAESMSAARIAGELMDAYELTISDIEIKNTACIEYAINIGGINRIPWDTAITALAKYCDCIVWFSKGYKWSGDGESSYKFFGMKHDIEMVEYLYKVISGAADYEYSLFRETDEYINARTNRRRATSSFYKGFAVAIRAKLNEMKSDRVASTMEKTGRSLVALKDVTVKEEFAKHGVKLGKVYRSHKYDNGAYSSGHNAGSKVKLNSAVKSNSNVAGYIT